MPFGVGPRIVRCINRQRRAKGETIGGERTEIGIGLDARSNGMPQRPGKSGVNRRVGHQSRSLVALNDKDDRATLPAASHLGQKLKVLATTLGRRIGETGQTGFDLPNRLHLNHTTGLSFTKAEIEAVSAKTHLALDLGVASELRQRVNSEGGHHEPVGQLRVERDQFIVVINADHLEGRLASDLVTGREEQANAWGEQLKQAPPVGHMGADDPPVEASLNQELIGAGEKSCLG